jgi:hypothetical protein
MEASKVDIVRQGKARMVEVLRWTIPVTRMRGYDSKELSCFEVGTVSWRY